MKNIALFASGTGSNVRQIVHHFSSSEQLRCQLIVSNNPKAPVLDFAQSQQIPHLLIDRPYFYTSEDILTKFKTYSIDYIVLAGFLWLVPSYLVQAYPRQIINIHPALLPKYGGKGMYGHHVHKAVHQAQEPESGISIHYVNEQYDEGDIIFQAACPLHPLDQPNDIARKVQKLEHLHYAKVIESLWT